MGAQSLDSYFANAVFEAEGSARLNYSVEWNGSRIGDFGSLVTLLRSTAHPRRCIYVDLRDWQPADADDVKLVSRALQEFCRADNRVQAAQYSRLDGLLRPKRGPSVHVSLWAIDNLPADACPLTCEADPVSSLPPLRIFEDILDQLCEVLLFNLEFDRAPTILLGEGTVWCCQDRAVLLNPGEFCQSGKVASPNLREEYYGKRLSELVEAYLRHWARQTGIAGDLGHVLRPYLFSGDLLVKEIQELIRNGQLRIDRSVLPLRSRVAALANCFASELSSAARPLDPAQALNDIEPGSRLRLPHGCLERINATMVVRPIESAEEALDLLEAILPQFHCDRPELDRLNLNGADSEQLTREREEAKGRASRLQDQTQRLVAELKKLHGQMEALKVREGVLKSERDQARRQLRRHGAEKDRWERARRAVAAGAEKAATVPVHARALALVLDVAVGASLLTALVRFLPGLAGPEPWGATIFAVFPLTERVAFVGLLLLCLRSWVGVSTAFLLGMSAVYARGAAPPQLASFIRRGAVGTLHYLPLLFGTGLIILWPERFVGWSVHGAERGPGLATLAYLPSILAVAWLGFLGMTLISSAICPQRPPLYRSSTWVESVFGIAWQRYRYDRLATYFQSNVERT